MKVNTKNHTEPLFLRYNGAIPQEAYSTQPGNNDTSLGREVLYEPTLILTPVLASRRVHQQTAQNSNLRGKRSLLDRHDVNALIETFGALHMGGGGGAAAPTPPPGTTTTAPPAATCGRALRQQSPMEESPALGRCTKRVRDPKTGQLLEVTVSGRFL